MIEGLRVLALIPARGGSKGLPLKNIQQCAGRPLMGWTVEAAKASKYVDAIHVSSDSDGILEAARLLGVGAIKRPDELATDEAETAPAVLHTLDTLEDEDAAFDVCVLLQPTSPLRTAEDIDGALERLMRHQAKTVASVYESYAVPFTGVDPPRRQERKPTLMLNGAVYAFDVRRFRETRALIDADTATYVMPQSRSVDVDVPLDMAVAAMMIGGKY
jgi:CMP-N-acetylneuraminic acid synthetase